MTDDSELRWWYRGHRRRNAVLALVGFLVAGGVAWLVSGLVDGGDAVSPREALGRGCGGVIAVDEAMLLFDGVELARWNDHMRANGTWCRFRERGSEQDIPDLFFEVGVPTFHSGPRGEPEHAPLGGQWTGSFFRNSQDAHTGMVTVLLGCDEEGFASFGRDGLLLTVTATLEEETFEDRGKRRELAALATATARNLSEREDCGRGVGQSAPDVPRVPRVWEYEDLERADGTCAGLLDRATAARLGVRNVSETAAERGVLEDCALRGWRGAPLYTMEAAYGPYGAAALEFLPAGRNDTESRELLRQQQVRVMTAQCPGMGTAVYTVRSAVRDAEHSSRLLPHDQELAEVLESFAERSARRHGCSGPVVWDRR